jgi:type II secretory pathway pseudopilin PulG
MGRRRGTAAVALLAAVAMIEVIMLAAVLGSTRDSDVAVRRLETVQAFYAAEAGINMAIREVRTGQDHDGDGGVGTVSNDGEDATDPVLGSARVRVTSSTDGDDLVLRSEGRCGQAWRHIEARAR